MFKRITIFIASLSLVLSSIGGMVDWTWLSTFSGVDNFTGNSYFAVRYAHTADEMQRSGHYATPERSWAYSFNQQKTQMILGDDGGMPVNLGANCLMLVLANTGDVLTHDYFSKASESINNDFPYVCPDEFPDITASEMSVELATGKRYYLAMMFAEAGVYDPAGGMYYGTGYAWIECEVTPYGIYGRNVATTFDDGLIVGTDDFATTTPEPSAALLVVLGLGLLGLRRRGQQVYDNV